MSNKMKKNSSYSDEIKKMKKDFKKMIDEMSNEEFMDFHFLLIALLDDFENDSEDNDWDYENLDIDEDFLYNEQIFLNEEDYEDLPF